MPRRQFWMGPISRRKQRLFAFTSTWRSPLDSMLSFISATHGTTPWRSWNLTRDGCAAYFTALGTVPIRQWTSLRSATWFRSPERHL